MNKIDLEIPRKQALILSILTLLIAVVAFALGYFTRQLTAEKTANYPLLAEAISILREHAYKPLPEGNKMEYGLIRGALQAFDDPHTIFNEPPAAELQTNRLEGKFGGIGVRIEKDKENNIVLFPIPDSPAQKAGVTDADRLLEVDKLTIKPETSLDEIQAAIRGPVGSMVKILLLRAPSYSDQTILELERAEVASPSLNSNITTVDPEVGIIRLNVIADTSSVEISKAIEGLSAKGAKHLIFDLRDNGGGLLKSGVNIAELFLMKGQPVIQQQFRGENVISYTAQADGAYDALPLVILVNQNTASAAEILAGALQYNHRAKILGNRSYGKDSVQLVYPLKDGSSINVTAGKWWLPEQKELLGGKGLIPDYLLNDADANSGAAIEKAVDVLKHP